MVGERDESGRFLSRKFSESGMLVSPRFEKYVESLTSGARSDFYKDIDVLFEKHSALAAAHVVRTQLSGKPLARRTGNLARSVIGRAMRIGGIPGFKVGIFRGPALRYARIHEEGGVITPRSGKALSIPPEGGPAVTPAGVTRYGPREFPGELHYIPFRNRGGNAIGVFIDDSAFQQLKAGASLRDVQAAYLLVKRVVIKARRYLDRGVTEYLPRIRKDLAQVLRDQLNPSKRSRARA